MRLILEHGPTAIQAPSGPHTVGGGDGGLAAPAASFVVECPQQFVGRIIGTGGATIRELQVT